jgi:CRP-like cAMP-binding protein
MSRKNQASKNHMLAQFPKADWERWQDKLEPVELHVGAIVFEVGHPLKYAYFPATAIISITRILINGESIEVGMIGSEGVVGASTLLGNGMAANRGVVLRSGNAYRICGSWMKAEYERSPHLMQMMLLFTQALITQLSQVGACNCHHPVEQRLSRWLLVFADRANTTQIICTQEQIANTLGVRRERLAKAAIALQKKGLIRYRRGTIDLLSRSALEAHTCECYGAIKIAYDVLISQIA